MGGELNSFSVTHAVIISNGANSITDLIRIFDLDVSGTVDFSSLLEALSFPINIGFFSSLFCVRFGSIRGAR